jgi:hypothetical protein
VSESEINEDYVCPSTLVDVVPRDLVCPRFTRPPSSHNPREFLKIFVLKCQNCSQFCDLPDRSRQIPEKAARLETLRSILEVLRNNGFAKRFAGDALSSAQT